MHCLVSIKTLEVKNTSEILWCQCSLVLSNKFWCQNSITEQTLSRTRKENLNIHLSCILITYIFFLQELANGHGFFGAFENAHVSIRCLVLPHYIFFHVCIWGCMHLCGCMCMYMLVWGEYCSTLVSFAAINTMTKGNFERK